VTNITYESAIITKADDSIVESYRFKKTVVDCLAEVDARG